MQDITVAPLPIRKRAGWSTSVLIAVWLCAVALGWYCVVRYEFSLNEPPAHAAVASWPSDSPLEHVVGRSTIVMFVHPKCPCTRATLNELERLLTATAGRQTPFDLLVIVTVPQAADPSWWNTDTVQHAERIAGARLYIDRDGREAARFGATTSGFVMFFDGFGTRRFAGGITLSRGHEGPSAGCDRLAELLSGKSRTTIELPAFGCRLCLPEAERETNPPKSAARWVRSESFL